MDDALILKHAATLPANDIEPYYETKHGELIYVGVKTEDSGKKTERKVYLSPRILCDAFDLAGRGIDERGEHYRILKWRSRGEQKERIYPMPAAYIGEKECWAALRRGGLAVSSNRGAQEKLSDYLQKHGSEVIYRLTERGGWFNGAYILPSGKIIGKSEKSILYHGDTSSTEAYQVSGTVNDWRDNVARLARGNSRPSLAIGCAFAAPLLHLLDMESGGFHLYGFSGTGKSTSCKVGASVWGHPDKQRLTWDATALALSNAAAARNDGLMWIEEVGQGKADAVGLSAYRLFNGMGKMQGSPTGGNRITPRFRTLVLSTGEHSISDFLMNGNQKVDAGQKVRLPSIPADAGKDLGAFDTLNGCYSSGALAELLEECSASYHGAVGVAFIEQLTGELNAVTALLKETVNRWLDKMPEEATGQARRVVRRFAIVAAALELATRYGLTGWEQGDGESAIEQCFFAWLAGAGWGDQEEEQILRQAVAFFAANGYGRFISDHDAKSLFAEPLIQNSAGYRKKDKETGDLTFLVFPHVFKDEISKGYELTKVAKIMYEYGMLKKGNDGRFNIKHRTPDYPKPRRFYTIISIEPIEK